MAEKQLTTRQVLTVWTGIMLCESMDDVYKALNHLSGASVFTHQIPDVMEKVKPELVKFLPWLSDVSIEEVDTQSRERLTSWISKMERDYGSEHTLPQVISETEVGDPIQDLVKMVGPDRVVVVQP